MSIQYVGKPNVICSINSGVFQKVQGTVLDLSGNGVDLSGTQMLKVAPFNNNKDSFYALLDLSNNTINNVDCSGHNIIRVANGSVTGVGYISNPSVVNSFVCDTSSNLWVGGNAMSVKTSNGGSTVANTRSMFIVPRENVTSLPTSFSNVDVSGCNDICPVGNLMVASVVDVSGACLNYYSTGNTLTVDGLTLPRMLGNNTAFNLFFNNDVGGPVLADKNMDLSGHRIIGFGRNGYYGNDVSGVYVIRQNSNSAGTAGTATLSDAGNTSYSNIPSDLSFNKLGYDIGRKQLYALPGGIDDKYPLIIPLDASANVYTTKYTCKSNALISYAAATGTSGAVDASGFMVVCTNPSAAGARPVIKLDASGSGFDTLTLTDVSGVNAMGTATALYNNTNTFNYIYLVDASRNEVGKSQFNTKPKVAEIRLSTRSSNTNNYYDGSGVSFVSNFGNSNFGYSTNGTNGHSYIRDLKIDSCGNIFIGGHHININVSQKDQQSNITGTTANGVPSSNSLTMEQILELAKGNNVIGGPPSFDTLGKDFVKGDTTKPGTDINKLLRNANLSN